MPPTNPELLPRSTEQAIIYSSAEAATQRALDELQRATMDLQETLRTELVGKKIIITSGSLRSSYHKQASYIRPDTDAVYKVRGVWMLDGGHASKRPFASLNRAGGMGIWLDEVEYTVLESETVATTQS